MRNEKSKSKWKGNGPHTRATLERNPSSHIIYISYSTPGDDDDDYDTAALFVWGCD